MTAEERLAAMEIRVGELEAALARLALAIITNDDEDTDPVHAAFQRHKERARRKAR